MSLDQLVDQFLRVRRYLKNGTEGRAAISHCCYAADTMAAHVWDATKPQDGGRAAREARRDDEAA